MNAVITGTSSGLGKELFDRFRQGDHRVIGSTHLEDLVNPEQFHLDLLIPESISRFCTDVSNTFGGQVDMLINNAGINSIRPFEDLSDEFIMATMAVNFIGPVMLVQKLLPDLTASDGTVINIVSDASWRPMRHSLAYNCSKAALAMATKQMARELTKKNGISVLSVNPGKMTGTRMSEYIDRQVCELRGWTPQQARDYYIQNSVTGKELPPALVADFIHSLVIGGMPIYMSGACMDLVG